MHNFILSNRSIDHLQKFDAVVPLLENWKLYINGTYTDSSPNSSRYIIIGDYIGSIQDLTNTLPTDIPKQKGNFYAIIITGNTIAVYNSFFSILPLYYTTQKTCITSSITLLKSCITQEYHIDKKFILENLLFNYGFFNRTLYQNIQLAPCHTFFEIQHDNVTLKKHFNIADSYTQTPKGGTKVADQLSDLFIKNSKYYFPDSPFSIAFTSGFDGRTLVSCATYHQKTFDTFSFGRPENDDVAIPQKHAAALGIPYQYIDLGTKTYIEQHYYENAKAYTIGGYTGNGLLYPHFLHSTKEIAKQSSHILSGAAGSELFRALHLTGAVTSSTLFNVFTINDEKELKALITNAPELKVIEASEFATELDELITEIIQYKKQLPQHLTPNQQFYIFVFEEIFRKFFGQWIATQQQYACVRTPFLDYEFVVALLQTKYAGANNDFFTKNPFKRIKGQFLYADIIRKTNAKMYTQTTGKGYRPIDVRNAFYTYNILWPFIKKRMTKKVKRTNLDNLGIISGIQHQQEHLEHLIKDNTLFNPKILLQMLTTLSAYTPESKRDTLLMALSLIHQLQHHSTLKDDVLV